jgi:glycosyltransferase involved in cell wall biosynthesis
MRVSIVIPTFNRSLLLPRTIPALANQKVTPELEYEVIFVSNGSTDNSGVILQDAVSQYPDKFRYIYSPPTGGPSAPRNIGIRAATGDVIIILDDDVLPDPELLLRHAEFHKAHPEPHHAALGEAYVPSHLLDDPMSLFHGFPYEEVRNLQRLSYLHFWTCNVSFKRQFMLAHGMFDERFLYYEDMICAHRLASHGMHLHFVPAARGQHLHQLKASAVPAKGQWVGRWLYPFVEQIPERDVKKRFGILSMDIGILLLVKRLLMRMAFRVIDNSVTITYLKLAGATGNKRNRITDFYYFLVFRRNLLAGYYQAKREAQSGRPLIVKTPRSECADKCEG